MINWTPNAPSTAGGVESLSITGGSGADSFTIDGTSDLQFGISLDAGTNDSNTSSETSVNVQSTMFAVDVSFGGGASRVTIGSLAPTTGGTLSAINGRVFVSGDGSTSLVVDDSGDPNNETATLTASALTGLAPAPIGFDLIAGDVLTVDGGNGDNTYNIQGTSAGVATTLNTGAGNGLTDGVRNTINVGIATQVLDEFPGPLTVFGQAGSDNLVFVDSAPTNVLAAPTPTSPEGNANTTTPTFKWSTVTGATGYALNIVDTTGNSFWSFVVNPTQADGAPIRSLRH